MQFLYSHENFLHFHLQAKHNASFHEITIGEPIGCKDNNYFFSYKYFYNQI